MEKWRKTLQGHFRFRAAEDGFLGEVLQIPAGLRIMNPARGQFFQSVASNALRSIFWLFASVVIAAPADYVNVFIGTDAHGHTYPGATVPYGMVQLSPDNGKRGWDWCSGYHWSCDTIVGFSHTHLSGTGCADLGDILFTPTLGEPNLSNAIVATYMHEREQAAPGSYGVQLDNGIDVKLTATERVGVHRYAFPRGEQAGIVIDLEYGQDDSPTEGSIGIESPVTVSGHRFSSGWASTQKLYFVAGFSRPLTRYQISRNDTLVRRGGETTGKSVKLALFFDTATDSSLYVFVGISPVSIEQARANLRAETSGKTFDKIREEAAERWNQALGVIDAELMTDADRTTFYSALYHTMLAPTLLCDADSTYRGGDGKIYEGQHLNYCTFSLWDTYRAAHPLYTIIQPQRVNDWVNTMLAFKREYGRLPIWSLAGDETWCMIGYHSVPVIADAYLKGFRGFDSSEALEAMKHSAGEQQRGLEFYNRMTPKPLADKLKEINASAIYTPEELRHTAITGKEIVGGYGRSVSGETIHYWSSHPLANSALLARATDGTMQVTWETQAVPAQITSDSVTFVWLTGICTFLGGHRFDLYGNGQPWLRFHTLRDTTNKWFSVSGKSGVRMTFAPTFVDRFRDVFGEMYLTVPTTLLNKGEPLALTVIGERGESSDWYMTFEHVLRDTVFVEQQYALGDEEGTRFQFASIFIETVKASGAAELSLGDYFQTNTKILPGLNRVEAILHEVSSDMTLPLTVHYGKQELKQNVVVKPVEPIEYIPADKEKESVSKTLEYAYDDNCIAEFSRALGKTEAADHFGKRAGYWKNLYDSETGFMRGKKLDGSWVSPFNPLFGTQKQPEYTEGNAWQYSWYVPQDVAGMIQAMGGNEKFSQKLDSLFVVSAEMEGATADMTGLIGQYAHGNEPSHHIAYLYDYCGQPEKTQILVRRIMREFYTDKRDGLCGNEDCGQMSAWYVFSALGFYPVNPCGGEYKIGSPLAKRATINVGNGKTFTVIVENQSEENVLVKSVSLNGLPITDWKIRHEQIMRGGELRFVMGE